MHRGAGRGAEGSGNETAVADFDGRLISGRFTGALNFIPKMGAQTSYGQSSGHR